MRTTRIYIDVPLSIGAIALDQAAGQHLITVLRLKVGAAVQLFNGQGQEFSGHISQADKKKCMVTLTTALATLPPSPLHTHLGLSITKGDRMDFAIQKSVELGVSEITPLFSQFTDVSLDAERIIKKQMHWQKIAIHACEQCGRADVPPVRQPLSFLQWIQQTSADLHLILHPLIPHPYGRDKTQPRLSQLLTEAITRVAFCVGPEGGFHEQEVETALAHHFYSVQLGGRILRSETAPLTLLAILQWLRGDLIQ